MADLTVEDVRVRYGANEILKGITAHFADGEIVALLGRSGSGKSTLLRAVAGLETPVAGLIRIGDETVFYKAAKLNVAPERRNLGLVFQSYALWPHMTVAENVAYGLKLRKHDKDKIASAVGEALEGVGLDGYGKRYPAELSGGQQQRVALARALVYSPPLILLDEPLSNLDAKLREEARIWIRTVIKERALTAIFVTHDQVEAMAIADRIMLLDEGRIVQDGAPEQLYANPATYFAAEFMGQNNQFRGRVVQAVNGCAAIQCGEHVLWGMNKSGRSVGEEATAVIRVEGLSIPDATETGGLDATLESSIYVGGRYEHQMRAGDQPFRVLTTAPLDGGRYRVDVPRNNLWIF